MAKKANKTTNRTNKTNMTNVALSYLPVVGWVPAAVFMLTETDHVVRWHAMQALLLDGLAVGLFLLTDKLLVGLPLVILTLVLQGVLTFKSYNGQLMRLPVLADLADNIVKKIK